MQVYLSYNELRSQWRVSYRKLVGKEVISESLLRAYKNFSAREEKSI